MRIAPDPAAAVPVLRLLNVASAINDAFAIEFQRIGLTEARFSLVMIINRLEWEAGTASPSQLAEQAGIGRAAMTQMLDALESTGWIKRSPSKQDRRKLSVKLTPKAKRTLDRFLPAHYERVAKVLEELSPADKRQITRLLAAIESGLG